MFRSRQIRRTRRGSRFFFSWLYSKLDFRNICIRIFEVGVDVYFPHHVAWLQVFMFHVLIKFLITTGKSIPSTFVGQGYALEEISAFEMEVSVILWDHIRYRQ